MKNYLLLYINNSQLAGYKIYKNNHSIFNTTSCKRNMTYENYINQPMSMLERRININIAKNPSLINLFERNKNHPLFRKYSHIPFNI